MSAAIGKVSIPLPDVYSAYVAGDVRQAISFIPTKGYASLAKDQHIGGTVTVNLDKLFAARVPSVDIRAGTITFVCTTKLVDALPSEGNNHRHWDFDYETNQHRTVNFKDALSAEQSARVTKFFVERAQKPLGEVRVPAVYKKMQHEYYIISLDRLAQKNIPALKMGKLQVDSVWVHFADHLSHEQTLQIEGVLARQELAAKDHKEG